MGVSTSKKNVGFSNQEEHDDINNFVKNYSEALNSFSPGSPLKIKL